MGCIAQAETTVAVATRSSRLKDFLALIVVYVMVPLRNLAWIDGLSLFALSLMSKPIVLEGQFDPMNVCRICG